MDPLYIKEKNRKKFEKTGRNRRQDHATRRNTNHKGGQRWFDFGFFDRDEVLRQSRLRIARRGGDEPLIVSDED